LQVGDIFDLGPRKWIVVGIMKTAGTTRDSEVWGDSALVGDMFGKKVFTSLVVKTKGAAEAEELARVLADREIMRGAAFAAQTEPKYYSALGTTSRQFNGAIVILAFFIGLGGVVGIQKTKLAAVSQRTKDIGVLRIIGFARWQILVSFFLESLLLALLGGLIGLGLGSLTHGMTATGIVSSGQGGGKTVVLQLIVDGWVVSFGILFSLTMGAIGGIFPALSAMRLRPLESLR
jgi:ABC-type antimicrobial peptide transport system permease subunit